MKDTLVKRSKFHKGDQMGEEPPPLGRGVCTIDQEPAEWDGVSVKVRRNARPRMASHLASSTADQPGDRVEGFLQSDLLLGAVSSSGIDQTLVDVFIQEAQGHRLQSPGALPPGRHTPCLLYTSDAADDLLCVDLGGRRIIQ